jgi:TolA-binding protein
MRNNKLFVFFMVISMVIPFFGMSQQPVQQRNPEKTWSKANDLFVKQKYAEAEKYFSLSSEYFKTFSDPRLTESKYYEAYCSLKLYNRNAEFRFNEFLDKYPSDPKVAHVYFLLGEYNFERKKYKPAIGYFEQLSVNRLESENVSDYYYYYGYSNFMVDDYEQAQSLLSYNLNTNDPFYHPATYYLAYIDYLNEDYESALIGFEKLKTIDGFSALVPYYIAQIYFLQGRYQELISLAEPWFKSASSKHKYEMARLIGESYFHEKQFDLALPYFVLYFNNSTGFSRDDYYAYGYTLYKNEAYKKAIDQLNKVTDADDALSQVAMLNLGDCFLKTEQYKSALTAFSKAAKPDYNKDVTEEAYFNYAKISYQLSLDPYDEAIMAFEAYLDSYPNSARKDEAYLFLMDVYLKTGNYQAAYNIISKIKNINTDVKRAYQLSVYNLAVTYFLAEDYVEAQRWFQLVGKYNIDKIILAESYYWQGELNYRKKNFRGALESYQYFLNTQRVKQSKYYADGFYGKGYALLKLKSYQKSGENFQLFIDYYKGDDNKKLSDAALRIGDLQFISKEYDSAIAYFNKAMEYSSYDRDYALYQIAMSYGYLEKPDIKIAELNKLIAEIPGSVYIPKALFELGVTYFEIEKYDLALTSFQSVEDNNPSSRLVAQARLKRGLIYIRTKQNIKAEAVFLSVIEDYPNTLESNEALISLKEVNLEAFTNIARTTGYANVSEDDVDAANFNEAEEIYLQGNYEKAVLLLGHYLNGFPNGRFRQNAQYYKADCHVRLEQPDSALVQFTSLLVVTGGPYYENALYMSAYFSATLGDDEQAYTYYKMLYEESENKQYRFDALNYLIFTGFKLGDYENTVIWAEEIREDEKPDESLKQKALLIEMKSLVNLDQKQVAFDLLSEANLELRDETSAEIWYLKALWLYEMESYEKAENSLFFLLQNFASFPEWRAKGFILLGDVYVGLDDDFQAKATWQSVINNHKGAELVAVAQEKLDHLLAIEKEEQNTEKEEIELDYNPVDKKVESMSIGVDTTNLAIPDSSSIAPIKNEAAVSDTLPDNSENNEHE